MSTSWLFRALLLKTLRTRHPDEFADLGYPSNRQLASLSPRLHDLHIKFWKYLWGGKFFLIKDKHVSSLAWVVLISDIALAVSVVAIFWFARK